MLFANRNLEPKALSPYQPLLDAGLIRRFYLEEMPELANAPLGVSILYLIRQTESQAPATARNLVARAKTEIGDEALRADLIGHAQVARALGPYKLSLHSGSDKFSVYPLIAEAARGQVHLKTAGTSYLEALRVVSQVDPEFFREILALARERFAAERSSYHVSAQVERVPPAAALSDGDLVGLLDDFDAREVLHVTFGSVLSRWGHQLKLVLKNNEEAYYADLERHFARHLMPFGTSI